jgi:hypothetical protein
MKDEITERIAQAIYDKLLALNKGGWLHVPETGEGCMTVKEFLPANVQVSYDGKRGFINLMKLEIGKVLLTESPSEGTEPR